MAPGSSILVGKIGSVFWMRVDGKGSFQNSAAVKRCFQEKIAEGMRVFVVDLECCPMMDSTFLGTLTGAALSLRESGEGSVNVVNVNPKNHNLLTSLGLDHILEVDQSGTAWADERKQACDELTRAGYVASCKEEQRSICREAHEALAEASPENRSRFMDLLSILQK